MAPPKIYGLIGYPVKHSLSAAMHNAAFNECGINAEYRLFEVKPADLEEFLLNPQSQVADTKNNVIAASDILGFNVTVPHKVRAKQILEEEFAEILEQKVPLNDKGYKVEVDLYYVKLSGAVNTVKRYGNKLQYCNTDAFGFLRSLKEDLEFDTKDKSVFLVGCGGAGRAIIAALSWINTGIKCIYVYDSSQEAVNSAKKHFQFPHLKNRLRFIEIEQIPQVLENCQLLVNATPIGMKKGEPSVIDKNLLHKDLYVYDVVYNRETQLVKDAKEKRCKGVAGGLGMLLYQGVAAWEFWMGKDAPVKVMRQALEDALREKRS
ncbi:MAG: shikimate dehydrogenase [Candidatus Omnitrophota bacterium]|nr:MAG: shikimate dehydrogenase [Candidatus Omnitrophota bacterium]